MKLSAKYTLVLLILILLLGTGLRFYQLGAEDFWFDETCTIAFAKIPWSEVEIRPFDFPHFVYNTLIMHFWIKLGETKVIVRLFSALVGIASLGLMYIIGRRLFDAQIGLFSTLFLALSSYHIYYSQEARAYALQVFLILCMVYFFHRHLEENRTKFLVIFSFLSLFTIHLQAFSIFSWVALNAYFLVLVWNKKETHRVLPWVITQGTVFVCCFPYFSYLTRPEYQANVGWIPQPSLQDIENMFELFSIGWVFWVIPKVIRWVVVPGFIAILLLSVVKFDNLARKIKVHLDRHQGLDLAWSLFAIPLILSYAISFIKPIFLSYRYMVIILPFCYLLVAYGLTKLQSRVLKMMAIGLLLLGMVVGLYAYYHEVKKIRWSQVAQYLDKNGEKNDLILVYQGYWQRPLHYYLKSPIPIQPLYRKPDFLIRLNSAIAGHPRIWLIVVTVGREKPPAEFITILQNQFSQQQTVLTTDAQQPEVAHVAVIQYSMPVGYAEF